MSRYASSRKPTLGYESKSAAIRALKQQGFTYGEIGRELGMKPKAASSLLARSNKTPKSVEVLGNVYLDIAREARLRKLTPEELINKLLANIASDKLYNAVLEE